MEMGSRCWSNQCVILLYLQLFFVSVYLNFSSVFVSCLSCKLLKSMCTYTCIYLHVYIFTCVYMSVYFCYTYMYVRL